MKQAYLPFTDQDKKILKCLCRQASYTNENIINTSVDTTSTSVEKSKQLLDDAKDQLYVESHPQYTYSDTIENIYALPEFKKYHDKLNENDYIYLGIDEGKYIKLRVTKITYNPCDMDSDMTIEFSNMTQYKTRNIDYNSLIDGITNSSSHDGGSVQGVSKSATSSSYVLTADIVQQLFSNPYFTSKVSNTTSSNTGSSVEVDSNTIISTILEADENRFSSLSGKTGLVKALDSNYLTSSLIVNKLLSNNAVNKLFDSDITGKGSISGITLKRVTITDSSHINLTSDIVTSDLYKINSKSSFSIISYTDDSTQRTIKFGFTESTVQQVTPPQIVTSYILQNNTVLSSKMLLQADSTEITGDVTINTLSAITNISSSASSVIENCHTHTEMQNTIEIMQSTIDDLKKQIEELKTKIS